MLYDLERAYVAGTPSDEQSNCIDLFFDSDNVFWDDSGLSVGEGTDDETMSMIDYFLGSLGDSVSKHIRQMLIDWKEEGF